MEWSGMEHNVIKPQFHCFDMLWWNETKFQFHLINMLSSSTNPNRKCWLFYIQRHLQPQVGKSCNLVQYISCNNSFPSPTLWVMNLSFKIHTYLFLVKTSLHSCLHADMFACPNNFYYLILFSWACSIPKIL